MDQPTFCRIEYWHHLTQSWEIGHHGVNLMDPAKYVNKLAKNGTMARAVDPDSGDVVYGGDGDLL